MACFFFLLLVGPGFALPFLRCCTSKFCCAAFFFLLKLCNDSKSDSDLMLILTATTVISYWGDQNMLITTVKVDP